jgi:hypothetical protein
MPSLFSWTFLMMYSKIKIKSYGDKAAPCFRPFWIRISLDKYELVRTLLQILFKHISVSWVCRIQWECCITLPSWLNHRVSCSLFELCSWCADRVYSHFSPNIWRKQNIWSVFERLHRSQCQFPHKTPFVPSWFYTGKCCVFFLNHRSC